MKYEKPAMRGIPRRSAMLMHVGSVICVETQLHPLPRQSGPVHGHGLSASYLHQRVTP